MIEQNITLVNEIPLRSEATSEIMYRQNVEAFLRALKILSGEFGIAIPQFNSTAATINEKEESAVNAAEIATDKAEIATNKAAEAVDAKNDILNMQVETGFAGSDVSWDGTTLTVPVGKSTVLTAYTASTLTYTKGTKNITLGALDTGTTRGFFIGQRVRIYGDSTHIMDGVVTMYSEATNQLFVNVDTIIKGAGTSQSVAYITVAGEQGRSILDISRIIGNGSAGTTDVYEISYSDLTTSTFSVHNGADGLFTTLDSFTDVDVSSPILNQVLKWNGSAWVNSTISTGSNHEFNLSTGVY